MPLENQAPVVLNPLLNQEIRVGVPFAYQFANDSFFDPDIGSDLTYSALSIYGDQLPAWLRFDPGTRTISGTPTVSEVGFIHLQVVASDEAASTNCPFIVFVKDPSSMSGAILADTVWHTGETINLTGTVEIAEGVTLTVEPGVIINGNNNVIKAYGTLDLAGDQGNHIQANDVHFALSHDSSIHGDLQFNHVDASGGSFLAAAVGSGFGKFDVLNSTFNEVEGFYIWYPTSASSFVGNVFTNSSGLSIGTNEPGSVLVQNNVFAEQTTLYAIETWANYNDGVSVVQNSFLNTDRVALSIASGYSSAAMDVHQNYFGTNDVDTINAMILDRSDSLSRATVINVSDVASVPDPATPNTLHFPTGTDSTISLDEDSEYIFSLADFGFTDVDSAVLSKIKITDLESYGELRLNGSAIFQGYEISGDDVAEGRMTFTPASNQNGSGYYNLSFKVNDGLLYSINSNVLGFNVLPVNDIPIGSVRINGSAIVGSNLTATNTLSDIDGLGSIGYQWKADGININGATHSAYQLSESDVGKVITVVASYIDQEGTSETVSSIGTNRVLSGASNPEPVPEPTPVPGPGPDGVPDEVEAEVPSFEGGIAGDGNGDGILDTLQANVSSLPFEVFSSADSSSVFVTLVGDSNDGKPSGAQSSPLREVKQVDIPTSKPEELSMPLGLLSFKADATSPGSELTFSLYVTGDIPINGYFKEIGGQWVNIASPQYGGKVVSEGGKIRLDFKIADGGMFDSDGIADGVVIDPGAIGYLATTELIEDADGDLFPDILESQHGLTVGVKDNDVLANSELFVMQLYRDILFREADPDGLAFWKQAIDDGFLSKESVAASFLDSPEFQAGAGALSRLYLGVLDRLPDDSGLTYWMGQLFEGDNLQAVAESFFASSEFSAKYGQLDNSAFIDQLYSNVLGRQPDTSGKEYWVAELDSGAAKGEVIIGFTESQEYRFATETEIDIALNYVGLLGRSPDQEGFDNWVAADLSGISDIQIVGMFMASEEYLYRFQP